jgi:hypothetical protein
MIFLEKLTQYGGMTYTDFQAFSSRKFRLPSAIARRGCLFSCYHYSFSLHYEN